MLDDCKTEQDKIRRAKSQWFDAPTSKRWCDFDFEDWFPKRATLDLHFYELGRLSSPVKLTVLVDAYLRSIFDGLVSQWKDGTWFVSSIKKRISHPAFLKIIGLGSPAIPLILDELRREPDYWSYALEAITREDAAPYARNLQELRQAWLLWGQQHGY